MATLSHAGLLTPTVHFKHCTVGDTGSFRKWLCPRIQFSEIRVGLNVTDQDCDTLCSQQGVSREVLKAISAQLLLFHSSILKPNFNLAVGEVQHSGKLKPLLFVDVNVKEELPLQLSNLKLGVWTPLLPRARSAWRRGGKNNLNNIRVSRETATRSQEIKNNILAYEKKKKEGGGQK